MYHRRKIVPEMTPNFGKNLHSEMPFSAFFAQSAKKSAKFGHGNLPLKRPLDTPHKSPTGPINRDFPLKTPHFRTLPVK
jgi:hypothetical protein